jgi:membrane-bound lytic murein transglycosylase B
MIRTISDQMNVSFRHAFVLALAGLVLVLAAAGAPVHAADPTFERWVDGLWPEARRNRISRKTFERAFRGVTPDQEVIEKAEHQPEFAKPVWKYLESAVSPKRIENGRKMLRAHGPLLAEIEDRYGVDKHIVLAIWGMETSYGAFLGDKSLIRSLATLGYTGSRQAYGRSQLLAALQILERGDITPDRMSSSWAGAMGHTQFIPTTYASYAVDYNGDGRRNIWESIPDALASTANYLKVSKWRTGETWGYEVDLPRNFNYELTGRSTIKTLQEWEGLGVRRVKGKAFPRPGDSASIVLPAGAKGPAFAILSNFRSILRYNNAISYALAVGHLADRIQGFNTDGFTKPWPVEYLPLARSQRYELQKLLAARGFLRSEVDGILGSGTRAAVRAYQKAHGMEVDGYPSVVVLKHLQRGS